MFDIRPYTVFFCMLFSQGCQTAGPHFRNLPATKITIQGSTFDIRVSERLAEAIRVNPQYAPRLGPIAQRAAVAMNIVSGCQVTEVRGDAAQLIGLLDCGSGPPPKLVAIGLDYECFALNGHIGSDETRYYADYECEAVPY